jgi:hypothetical protein
MTYPRFLAAASVAALFVLGACNTEPEVIGGPADPQAEALKNAPPVQLPPSIREAKTYRCRDNSIVHISFMSDGVTAAVRDSEEEPPVATLRAPAAGQPFTAEGYSLSGSGDQVTYRSPDKGSQSCRS